VRCGLFAGAAIYVYARRPLHSDTKIGITAQVRATVRRATLAMFQGRPGHSGCSTAHAYPLIAAALILLSADQNLRCPSTQVVA
jgi:hypothetical protein